ncbi:DUF4012 domain-containing protein [Arthrobacter crystallopoietes]|uniref:DUF4012 domain-containing protein n=1 Tax=Crystallibacter crystallopoietes TaxID=37928 RepID=A0A1H0ZRE7_9MICC|nr:DUF4012 domain-containing protein [Arthrobacter crystallopoietes]SDQ29949.1 Protein of unknown function [Arthrobacter crystallopoietes]
MRVVIPLAIIVLLVLLSLSWLTFRAFQVKDNLDLTTQLLPKMQEAMAAGDIEEATVRLNQMESHTAEARSAGTDPLWRAAGMLPWFGQNFAAVTDITVATDVVVSAAVPLMDSLGPGGLDAFVPKDGKIELGPLQELAPKLTRASDTVTAAYESLKQIDENQLVPQLSEPLGQATSALEGVQGTLNGAASASEILPAMLGGEGDRNYLVLVQNNAEVRATGGIPGALVVLKTSDGQIEFTDHGSASALGRFKPPLEVDQEQERIYTTRLGAYMQNVNLTPDFPTAATTAQAMWEKEHPKTEIDGVIALDPVVLSQLLVATGPVKLSSLDSLPVATGGLPTTLDSTNVVQTLLSDVYREIEEPQAQDAYFAAVASDTFADLSDGSTDALQMLKAVQQSAMDQRLFVWSEFEDEQAVISASTLSGSIPAEEPTVGVYFNDGTGAKMDYYVEREVQLIKRCQPDGYYRYAVQTTLTNNAPVDAAESLPEYVTGGGSFGVTPGTIRTNVYAYGPSEWLLESASVDGETSSFGSYRHGDSPVAGLTVSLKAGESTTVEFEFSTLYETDEPQLRVTPTVQARSEVVIPTKSGPNCTA